MSSSPRITKACPDCGRTLIIRMNRENGSEFIGCTGWPECRHTEPISDTLKMRLMGAPTLFDDPEPTVRIDRRPIERCRSCGAAIVWGTTAAGKACPYNVVGMRATEKSHFETCPQARGWSKR